jgi:hypothetical protein
LPATADAAQIFTRELHQARRSLAVPCGPVGPVAKNPDILCIFCSDPGKYGVGREKTL